MANLIGSGINQISVNGMLGNLAFQDKAYVGVDAIGIGTTFVDSGTVGQVLQVSGGAYVSGNLGIGTTNPTSKLHVVGDVRVSGVVTATTFVGALTGTATSTTNIPNLTGDITSVNSVTSIAAGVIVDSDINASAGIVDTKLATISTALKVSNSATTATNANTASAIVSRDASGNFSAGTITASLTGTATSTTNIPNLTGAITSNNTTTSLGSFTSSQLATALTDETGSGVAVFATSPTLVTPVLGAASATSIVVSSGSTFTNGPILVGTATSTGTASQRLQVDGGAYVSGSVGIGTTNPVSKLHVIGDARITGVVTATTFVGALTGTATSTTNIPNLTGAITSNNTTTSLGSFSSANLATALTDETGTGSAVFATSPTLVTPVLGAATATSINVSGIATINQLDVNQLSPDGSNYGTSLYVPVANGSGGWNWGTIVSAGAGNLNGIDIREEGTIVGTAGSTTSIDFRGNNIIAIGTAGGAIATVRVSDTPTFDSLVVSSGSTFTNGPILVGTATSTGTASQRLQVTGGAYVSGSVGIGTTNPSAVLDVRGNPWFSPNTTGVKATALRLGRFTDGVNAAFDIITDDNTGDAIEIQSNRFAGSLNFSRASPSGIQTTFTLTSNYLTGTSISIADTTGTTTKIKLDEAGNTYFNNTGAVLVGTISSTGTASQRLQVDGGAYVSGNLGIGTANPTSKLHVIGDVRVTGVVTATTFVGALTGTATSTTNIPNLTGAITSVNTTTSLGSFTSANLSAALTDETGSGSAVFATSPVLVTPSLGIATATSINASGIITATQLSTGASGTGVNITTNTISGPATLTIDPAAVGDNTGAVRIKGDLYVDGTQFIVNSTTIELADFNVGIATTVGTNALLDGAGIGIGSTGIRKTLTWNNSSTALKSSEDFDVASGKVYKIAGTSVLSNNTLGSGVVTSSLTSVGTLGQLQVTGVSTFTNGPILVGTATSTGTASQPLQVTGGAYVSGNLGIGTTNPFGSNLYSGLDVNRSNVKIFARNIGTASDAAVWAADQDYFTTPSYKGVGIVKYGPGTAGTIFSSIPYADSGVLSFQNTATGIIYTNGQSPLIFGTFSSERARFDGLTGNFGIGTANPTSKLHVIGDVRVTGVVTATTFVGALTGTATSTTNIPNLTGAITSVNTTTSLGSFTSAQLATALTDETGSGANVFATSPILVTPVLGAATATSIVVSSGSTFTNGPILVGTATSTGTASQLLQVNGGAYVSGNLGVGVTNPAANTQVAIAGTLGISEVGGAGTRTLLSASAAGFVLNHNDNSNIDFRVLSTSKLQYQYSPNFWTIPAGVPFLVGTATSTGTANQLLRVEGGAYVSGSVGIGTTNPGATLNVVPTATSIAGLFSGTTSSDMVRITQLGTGNALVVEDSANPDSSPFVVTGIGSVGIGTASPAFTADIAGDARVTSTNKMRFGGTAGTTNFYIQYNSTTNSLDFVAG